VIYRRLTEDYNTDELTALAYELTGQEPAMIFTDTDNLTDKAIAITTWAARKGQLPRLIELMNERRH
jgi:hypothetical protein